MGLFDKVKSAVKAVEAEAVIAKVTYDSKKAGYNPAEYAGFDGEGLQPEVEDKEKK